jgi:ketosteroid isomerase-like protein
MTMAGTQSAETLNKEVVAGFLAALSSRDLERLGSLLTSDAVRYWPRPSFLGGGPEQAAGNTSRDTVEPAQGRDRLVAESRANFYYRPGSITIEIERLIAENDYVAAQFILRAITRRDESYENYYHFLFRGINGKISQCWEYVDTLYAQKMLFE